MDIPASTLEVIRKRLKDVGETKLPADNPLQTVLARYYGSRGRRNLADGEAGDD